MTDAGRQPSDELLQSEERDRRRLGVERSLHRDEVDRLESRLAAVTAELGRVSAEYEGFRNRRTVRAADRASSRLVAWLEQTPLRTAPTTAVEPDATTVERSKSVMTSWPPPPSSHRGSAGDEEVLVSVIMATWNRADVIGQAVDSVQAQTHEGWELIIIDDGSTDATAEMLAPYLDDDRIRVFEADHRGAAAARNLGLARAQGHYCAYLDTDNLWSPWFLEVMVGYLVDSGHDIAYAELVGFDDPADFTSVPTSHRGQAWDWGRCRQANFVDLNVLVHRRGLAGAWFDPSLGRNEDWDMVLRIGRDRPLGYLPWVGCRYRAERSAERVSVAQPSAFSKIVQLLNPPESPGPAPVGADRLGALDPAALSLGFDLVVSPPFGDRKAWGDHYLAQELLLELARLSHTGRLIYRDTERRPAEQVDVNLVMRGDTRYRPRPGAVNVLWVICDPERIEPDELAEFDLVYVASPSFAALLNQVPEVEARVLLQGSSLVELAGGAGCSPGCAGPRLAVPGGLFVGNSRQDRRRLVELAARVDEDLVVIGRGWEGTMVEPRLVGERLPRCCVATLYSRARYVVNDHFGSMVDFGIVSNRIFDVLAVGGLVVSDPVAELGAVFPSVRQIDPGSGDQPEVWGSDPSDTDRSAARRSLADRAVTLDRGVKQYLGLTMPGDSHGHSGKTRVVIEAPADAVSGTGPAHHLLFSRLLCPLTAGSAGACLDVTVVARGGPVSPPADVVLTVTIDDDEVVIDGVGPVPVSIDPRLWRHYRRAGVGMVVEGHRVKAKTDVIELGGLGLVEGLDPGRGRDGVDHYRLARRIRSLGPATEVVCSAPAGSQARAYEDLVAGALTVGRGSGPGDAVDWGEVGAAAVGAYLLDRI